VKSPRREEENCRAGEKKQGSGIVSKQYAEKKKGKEERKTAKNLLKTGTLILAIFASAQ